jgi:hypothetical protein
MLFSVADTTTPPSYTDSEGRLHLYYLAAYHTYEDAVESCEITGAHLITIRDDTEVSVATDLLDSAKGWVGAQDQAADECIEFDAATGQLQDANCSELKQGICEWEAPGAL